MRILGQYFRTQIFTLASIEMVLFFCAPLAAAFVRFGTQVEVLSIERISYWLRGSVFALTMSLCVLAMGLYSARQRAGLDGVLARIAASAVSCLIALAALYYIFPGLTMGRGLLGIMILFSAACMALVRIGFARMISDDFFKRRVLVYGAGSIAFRLSRLRRRSDQRGFVIVGFVGNPGDTVEVPAERLVFVENNLLDTCRHYSIEEIVVAMDDRRLAFPMQELLDCRLSDINVIDMPSFLERETGKVRLDVVNPSWMIFGEGFNRGAPRRVSARLFDIVASLALLALSWPLMLITAIAIKLEDGLRAPVIYRQKRVGLEGKNFDVLKFRSMRTDAEKGGKALWAEKQDPRVTRVGAVARLLRLDELPQIFNVLRGDMRFVGPRPERPEFVEELAKSIPFYRERHFAKPGITGWAQLCYPYGSSQQDAAEKLQYDLYYVKNHSLLFDLSILMQTAEVILWRKGSR